MVNLKCKFAPVVLLALAFTVNASAAVVAVDTGAPQAAPGHFPYMIDANDFYAGQVTFAQATRVGSIATYLSGGTAGETFTVSLYANDNGNVPGTEVYSAKATYGADGWNGVSALNNWNVNAAKYWVAFEVNAGDDLGSGSVTGALLPSGVTSPLTKTAFNSGSGYTLSASPLTFGLRVNTVPLPQSLTLMLAGLGLVGTFVRRKN